MSVTVAVSGKKLAVGNVEFMRSSGIRITDEVSIRLQALQGEGKTGVLVGVDSDTTGLIGLQDVPRTGAREAIDKLRGMGVESVMLTGDNELTANVIADHLGIGQVYAGVLPSGKVEFVKKIQQNGKKVAMVGHGFNDAPALTAADVGIAMGAGADLAIEADSVVLVRDDISDVIAAIQTAKKVISKVRQNLVYAFMYNVVLVPVAALGLLYPALAGLAMAASSVSVTSSSLALKRWNPRN